MIKLGRLAAVASASVLIFQLLVQRWRGGKCAQGADHNESREQLHCDQAIDSSRKERGIGYKKARSGTVACVKEDKLAHS